jgi:hypothetical protein
MGVLTPEHKFEGLHIFALPASPGHLLFLGLPLSKVIRVSIRGELWLIVELRAPLSHYRIIHHLDICNNLIDCIIRLNRRKSLSRGHLDIPRLISRRFLVGCIDIDSCCHGNILQIEILIEL